MGKYAYEPDSASEQEVAKARGTALAIHFKHTREIMHTIKGMKLSKAKKFLKDVIARKAAVPFTMFTGGIGRHAQLKQMKAPGSKGRWPVKAAAVIADLLENAEANAEKANIDVDDLVVKHAMSNRAPKTRRRTYRAHGRIGPYKALPAHCEIILEKASADVVAKGPEDMEGKPKKLTPRARAQLRITAGGGVE